MPPRQSSGGGGGTRNDVVQLAARLEARLQRLPASWTDSARTWQLALKLRDADKRPSFAGEKARALISLMGAVAGTPKLVEQARAAVAAAADVADILDKTVPLCQVLDAANSIAETIIHRATTQGSGLSEADQLRVLAGAAAPLQAVPAALDLMCGRIEQHVGQAESREQRAEELPEVVARALEQAGLALFDFWLWSASHISRPIPPACRPSPRVQQLARQRTLGSQAILEWLHRTGRLAKELHRPSLALSHLPTHYVAAVRCLCTDGCEPVSIAAQQALLGAPDTSTALVEMLAGLLTRLAADVASGSGAFVRSCLLRDVLSVLRSSCLSTALAKFEGGSGNSMLHATMPLLQRLLGLVEAGQSSTSSSQGGGGSNGSTSTRPAGSTSADTSSRGVGSTSSYATGLATEGDSYPGDLQCGPAAVLLESFALTGALLDAALRSKCVPSTGGAPAQQQQQRAGSDAYQLTDPEPLQHLASCLPLLYRLVCAAAAAEAAGAQLATGTATAAAWAPQGPAHSRLGQCCRAHPLEFGDVLNVWAVFFANFKKVGVDRQLSRAPCCRNVAEVAEVCLRLSPHLASLAAAYSAGSSSGSGSGGSSSRGGGRQGSHANLNGQAASTTEEFRASEGLEQALAAFVSSCTGLAHRLMLRLGGQGSPGIGSDAECLASAQALLSTHQTAIKHTLRARAHPELLPPTCIDSMQPSIWWSCMASVLGWVHLQHRPCSDQQLSQRQLDGIAICACHALAALPAPAAPREPRLDTLNTQLRVLASLFSVPSLHDLLLAGGAGEMLTSLSATFLQVTLGSLSHPFAIDLLSDVIVSVSVATSACPGLLSFLVADSQLLPQLEAAGAALLQQSRDGPHQRQAIEALVRLVSLLARLPARQGPPWPAASEVLINSVLHGAVRELSPADIRQVIAAATSDVPAGQSEVQRLLAAIDRQQLALRQARALGLRRCANLGCTNLANITEAQLKSRKCSACMVVRFCSEECSRAAWSQHKAACRLLRQQNTQTA